MNKIYIVAAADERYAMLFCVMAASVLYRFSSENCLCFKLLTDELSDESKARIEALRKIRECRIDIVPVKRADLELFPTFAHLSPLANARLLIPSLLPDLHKVIYLDCDVIARSDVSRLWDWDLGDFPIAACRDFGVTSEELRPRGFHLSSYFNSGVLIMNLDQMRKMNFENAINLAASNPKLPADQDLLNDAFKSNWFQLPTKWNVQSELYLPLLRQYSPEVRRDFKNALKHPAIIHFAGRKPTSCRFRGRYRRLFWKYLRMTEYRDYKIPDWSIYNYCWRYIPNPVLHLGSRIKQAILSFLKHFQAGSSK